MAGPRGPWRRSRATENDSRGPHLAWYKNGSGVWEDPSACSRGRGCSATVTSTWSSIVLQAAGSRARARCHDVAPAACAAERKVLTGVTMAARGMVICRSTAAPGAPGTRYGMTCGQYKLATCSAMSRV
jgi:hypothetical protein